MARPALLIPLAALASVMLAGCASSGRAPSPAVRPPDAARQPTLSFPRPATDRGDPVIGRNAAALTALFGQPALDVVEGIARKLQFSGSACVLDAYLYAPRERAEPVVTHVDVRAPDGRDAERAACVAALRRR